LIFRETRLAGAFTIDIEPAHDARGFFARTWCAEELQRRGLVSELTQCSLSFNKSKGTLRGMHYQQAPHDETKVVSCKAGAIYDVIVDLRPDSSSFRQWCAVELSADNRRLLYIPAGLAHGFLTLQDDSEVYYQISGRFVSGSARGVRWNDPAFGIAWPVEPSVMAGRDCTYPDFAP